MRQPVHHWLPTESRTVVLAVFFCLCLWPITLVRSFILILSWNNRPESKTHKGHRAELLGLGQHAKRSCNPRSRPTTKEVERTNRSAVGFTALRADGEGEVSHESSRVHPFHGVGGDEVCSEAKGSEPSASAPVDPSKTTSQRDSRKNDAIKYRSAQKEHAFKRFWQ